MTMRRRLRRSGPHKSQAFDDIVVADATAVQTSRSQRPSLRAALRHRVNGWDGKVSRSRREQSTPQHKGNGLAPVGPPVARRVERRSAGGSQGLIAGGALGLSVCFIPRLVTC